MAAVTSCAAAVGARGEYAVIDLGALINTSTGTNLAVGGVNSVPQAAFTSALPDGSAYRAWRWAGGTRLNLGTLGGADSFGSGINGAGQVVGRSMTAGGVAHAYVWTPGGADGVATNPQMKDLTPTVAGPSQASAINASGQVAGYVRVDRPGGQAGVDRAFFYSGGTLTQLPLPGPGFSSSYAYGMNDAGKVVGEAYTAASPIATGFIYNGATSVELGTLGGFGSTPLAINSNGRVVGFSQTGDGVDHAFVYANGTMTDLGTLGGNYSYAKAINKANQIVGGAYADAGDSLYHAFTTDGVTMTDLNTKVTSRAAGWELREATGVNDDGVIVGTGTLAGAAHGFMLRPLAPGDATADGRVNFSDLVALAQNYNATDGANWERGDFTGDHAVNFSDLVLLAQNYNTTQWSDAAAAAQAAGFSGEFRAAMAAVPEPGLAGAAALAAVAGAARRRRR